MPHDPIDVSQTFIGKSEGSDHDTILLEKYEAPSTPDSGIADDPYKEADAILAKRLMEWLRSRYPGYPWCAVADLAQGIAKFNIPIITGVTDWYVINLHTTDIADGLVDGAGEILERYCLPRGKFELGSFLEARANHSKLVMPSRKIPE
jgi:hypothetical protein